MAKAKLKTFTLVLAWGESDEGNYHTALRARNSDHAERLAREEMDRTHNDECATDDPDMRRGKSAGEPTTEYEVITCIEGVNEYAAPEMLAALKAVSRSGARKLSPAILKTVRHAIARGEARA